VNRLDNIGPRHRGQREIAPNQMHVIAWQQDYVAGAKHETISILADPDADLTLDNVVIENQLRRWPKSGRAMFGPNARRHAPGCEELRVQEDPAGQTRHPQDVR
jgi:hypothetical protein